MSAYTRCDRCHKFFQTEKKEVVVLQFRETKNSCAKILANHDVCTECMALILAMFKPAPDENVQSGR